jgi:capsular exopolysaccharide synthesis family protein
MSRIYHALKKSDGQDSNVLVQLIDASAPNGKVLARSEETIPEQMDEAPPEPALVSRSSGDYRIVSLSIPAGVPVFPFDGLDGRAAEQYRLLRTNVLQHAMKPQVIAVTSATPGDGKTITSINLAGILALKSDYSVLIIDADLRHSAVTGALGIDAEPGLGDVLAGRCTLEDAIVQIDAMPTLHVLPAGQVSLNPAELLDSQLFRAIMAALREHFTYIVVDTTPIGVVADFKLVHQVCDGAVLVLRPDHTKRSSFMRAFAVDSPFKILGTVINESQEWFLAKNEEYHEYYGPTSGKKNGTSGRRSESGWEEKRFK